MTDSASVLIRHEGCVSIVTLNRPDARNALNSELAAELPRAMTECDSRAETRAIVITGADPAFCAGFDLRDVGAGRRAGANEHPGYWGPFPPTRVPIIGAINGAAVTGGLEIAVSCDFLIASDRARFADTHAKVGMVPGWGLTIVLPRLVGPSRAVQMSLTGEFVDATTALSWGLVNEVVLHENLIQRAIDIGNQIGALDEGAVAEVRSLYRDMAMRTVDDAAFEAENMRARAWAKRRFG
jgi:enoyl-CoA hydratase